MTTTREITCKRVFSTDTLPVPISDLYLQCDSYVPVRCDCDTSWSYRCIKLIRPEKTRYESNHKVYPVAFYIPIDGGCTVQMQHYQCSSIKYFIFDEEECEEVECDNDINLLGMQARSLPNHINIKPNKCKSINLYLPVQDKLIPNEECRLPCRHVVKCPYQETPTGFITDEGVQYQRLHIPLRCDTVAVRFVMKLTQPIFLEHFVPAT